MSNSLVISPVVPPMISQDLPFDRSSPKGMISPSKILQIISQNDQSGCLVVADPKDNSVSWKLYLNGGQVNYITSAVGQRERLACLWQQFQNRLNAEGGRLNSSPLPLLKSEDAEYRELYDWWLSKKLPMAGLQALFVQLSQEALAQIFALESTSVKFFPTHQLEPTLINYPWQDFLTKYSTLIARWQNLRTEITSPFARLYLDPQKMFDFYKAWQTISKQPEALKVLGSRHLSFWLQILSQRKCLYEIAAQVSICPLTLALQLQPLLKAAVIEILPFQEVAESSPLPKAEPALDTSQPNRAGVEAIRKDEPTSVRHQSQEGVNPYQGQNNANLGQIKRTSGPVIACIDDSKTVQQQVKMTLEAVGYQVLNITEPASTLTLLVRQKPVLILLDINMPEIDGYELCQMLHRSRKLREIPIVMLTGREGFVDRIRAKFVGATDYLTKPFDPNLLIEVVQRLAPVSV